MSTKDKSGDELWDEYNIPGNFYMALARRGQESINSDQCFLEGCDNNNINELMPLEKETYNSEKDGNGVYFKCEKIKIKCKKCNGIFQFALKTIIAPSKDKKDLDVERDFMGIAYILDENGKNLGEIGYF